MEEPKIRSVEDLQKDVDSLKKNEELMCRQRTTLSQNINSTRKQIAKLEEMILNNNQYEMFED